jgi:hypothetical protein
MEIPVYNAAGYDNALSEGAFEIAGFRSFVEGVLGNGQYDNEQQKALLQEVHEKGTDHLSPEEFVALHAFVSHFTSVCQRCGNTFTWEEMDPINQEIYCSTCRNELENLEEDR